jgi:hypothetical protein
VGVRNGRWIFASALSAALGCTDPSTADEASTSASTTATSTPPEGTESDTGLTSGDSSGAASSSTGSGSSTGEPPLCNGSAALCDRPYDQVVFAGTHNSVAATESGFGTLNANQTHPVLRQLEDGIRVLLLDVTYDGEETVLCHGPCSLGSRPHIEVLLELREFMELHSGAIVTIIYQDSVDPADVEADFIEADLVDLTYTYEGGSWPTLGEMVAAGERLVVTAESGRPPPAWYQHVWDLTFDTPFTFMDPSEFSCTLNRGQADNPLFLINHWLNTQANLPDRSAAPLANSVEVLSGRVADCEAATGRRPTFIAVDFYEEGDLFAVVDALNE